MKLKNNKIENSDTKVGIEKPMTVSDVAEFLNKSASYVYKLTHTKKIHFYKCGKTCYFKQRDLEEFAFRNPISTNSEVAAVAQDFIFNK